MNHNPYLLWAKKIRLTNWFLASINDRPVTRMHLPFEQTAPYTLKELRMAPIQWRTNMFTVHIKF